MSDHSIKIDNDLYDDIKEYCHVNGLKVCEFTNDLIRKSLAVEKYGDIPFGNVITPSVHKEESLVAEVYKTEEIAPIIVQKEEKPAPKVVQITKEEEPLIEEKPKEITVIRKKRTLK